MLISLLLIALPTVLIIAILIPFINSSNKRVLNELEELKMQLEQLSNVSAPVPEKNAETPVRPEPEIQAEDNNEKEEKDAADDVQEIAASEYNTGKSGKTYTKEELELLIKE